MAREKEIKVYGYRWVVLGVFMLINMTIQFLWICFAPITSQAAQYYGVGEMEIGILAMVFMIVYIPMSIPASWVIDTFGFYKGVGLGSVLLGVFGMSRAVFSSNYTMVLLSTIGIALAQPLLMNAFTTVAAKWFPLNERATASGLGMVANFLGTAVGLMLTPYLVESRGIGAMQMVYGVAAAASAAAFLVLARESPPTSPSPPGFEERALVLDGLKRIIRTRDFVLLMIMFFVGTGVFNGVATWIESIVSQKGFTSTQAGITGGLLLIGGIVGASIIPPLSDRLRRRRPFIILGLACSLPGISGLILGGSYGVLLASSFLLGFFMISLAPVGFQYAAEITFPAPEGTSNGLLQLAGQASVIMIYGMGALYEATRSFTPSLLLAAVCTILSCVLAIRLKESAMIRESSPSRSGGNA